MNYINLFLPLALLCSLPHTTINAMNVATDEYVWVKDASFPTPKNPQLTQTRWIQVSNLENLFASKLDESVRLGAVSVDQAEKVKADIEFYKKQQQQLINNHNLQALRTEAAYKAAIKANKREIDRLAKKQVIAVSLLELIATLSGKQTKLVKETPDQKLLELKCDAIDRTAALEQELVSIDPSYKPEYYKKENANTQVAKTSSAFWRLLGY